MADTEDFPAFYDEQRTWVDYHVRRLRHRPEDRADLRQETWLRLWRTWPKFDPSRCTPKTWAWIKVREVARDMSKAVAHRPLPTVGLLGVDAGDVDGGMDTRGILAASQAAEAAPGEQELRLWKRERMEAVRRATTELEFKILDLLWAGGMDVPDVADALGTTREVVRAAKVRSIQRLVNAGIIEGWGGWGL